MKSKKCTTKRTIMIHLLHTTILAHDHTIITLMIFQIIMILAINKGNITQLCQQNREHPIFIDRIIQIINSYGLSSYYMRCSELYSFCVIIENIKYPDTSWLFSSQLILEPDIPSLS